MANKPLPMTISVASPPLLAQGLLSLSTPCSTLRPVPLFTGCSLKHVKECWISTSFVGITKFDGQSLDSIQSIEIQIGIDVLKNTGIIGKRTTPSVAGIIYPFGGQFVSKMYWGTSETLLPVYQAVDKACEKHPEVDTVNIPLMDLVKLLI